MFSLHWENSFSDLHYMKASLYGHHEKKHHNPFIVSALAVFFIRLSERFTGITDENDAEDVVRDLDGTEWVTDKEGKRTFERVFQMEAPQSLEIERIGRTAALFVFGDISTSVALDDGYLCGVLNGREFLVSVSQSHTGEGKAVSILSGEELIVFY